MRRLLLIATIGLGLCSPSAWAEQFIDSLAQVYPKLPQDTTRLGVIDQIIRIEQHTDKGRQYADTLWKEAEAQGNAHYQTRSAYYHTLFYYNNKEPDSLAHWLTIMESLVSQTDLQDLYFDARRLQIDLYTYNEEYELAISQAYEMKLQAFKTQNRVGMMASCQSLGTAYIATRRWTEGMRELEEAYSLITAQHTAPSRLSLLSQLVSVAKERKDYPNQLRYLQELDTTLNDHIRKNPQLQKSFADIYLFLHVFYAYYYIDTHQMTMARQHIEYAHKYMSEQAFFMYRVVYFDVCAQYYKAKQEYEQALNYIDTTLTMLQPVSPNDYAEQLLAKAQIWRQAGRQHKAIPLYREAIALKDSLAQVTAHKQMSQIQRNYNLDKLKIEQQKEHNRNLLMLTLLIFFILLVFFYFMRRLSKVRSALRLSENEIRKATETVQEANEVKYRFLSNMSHNIRTPLNNIVGYSQRIVYESQLDEETKREYSGIIRQSSDRLIRLVNSVLDLSRLEAHMMKFQVQTYDAVQLCHEVCFMAEMKNAPTGIKLHFASEAEMAYIETDTARLTQALLGMVTYPQESLPEVAQERSVRMLLSTMGGRLQVRIVNTPLADASFTSQETLIQNEINRLLLAHFGGTYELLPKGSEGPEIQIDYPLTAAPIAPAAL